MNKPVFVGLSHICVIVDNIVDAFTYYERILGAVPEHDITPYCKKAFFQAECIVKHPEDGDISMRVPGADLTLELMDYCNAEGRKEPIFFRANDVGGARHIALKVQNIEEAFAYMKAQPDVMLINTKPAYRVSQMSEAKPEEFSNIMLADGTHHTKSKNLVNTIHQVQYFYFIDRYGLVWEFEQGQIN